MPDLFDFQKPSNHFAVMGNPVAHSRSPQIHQLFARQFDIKLNYQRIQVDAGGFEQAVSHFAAHRGAGLNITLPFKVEAFQLCERAGDRLSDRARRAQAVNTLRFAGEGNMFGDNTDGVGIVRDIQNNLNFPINGKRVLVVGAGGAVRGVLGALTDCAPASLTVANRTAGKARELAESFNCDGGGLDDATGDFDLVVNGTSASVGGDAPNIAPACVGANTLAYDMMYARRPTAFMDWAIAAGAGAVSDGLGMLVEQAAESFQLWHDRRPDTAPVIDALRKKNDDDF